MAWDVFVILGTVGAFLVSYWWRRRKDSLSRIYSEEDAQSQHELNLYLSSHLDESEIGRLYERQIGYLYESQGHDVKYNGAIEGLGDLGRDLIVRTGRETLVIQAKCWSRRKWIGVNQVFQLYGSVAYFKVLSKSKDSQAKPVFYTTTGYSVAARKAASSLKVDLNTLPLDKSFPMIKCNVSEDGDKIYHLPFDPYYDRMSIEPSKGEFFALTVRDAVAKGFRRARKYRGVG